ncbi:DUF1275 domain protein [Meredithblackwellia eburnea MCA 4105]
MKQRQWWLRTVPADELVAPLCAVAFITGILDSGTYHSFRTFASNQTGNVVLLTLGAFKDESVELHNTIASLLGYLLMGFIGGQVAHRVGPRVRWLLLLSNLLQIFFLVLPLVLLATGVLKGRPHGTQWGSLALLAASSGFQVAVARTSGCQEIPTAMLSSPMIDFITDPRLFVPAWRRPELRARNRRLCYITSLVVGAFVGAWAQETKGFIVVLIVSISLKVLVMAWMAWLPAEEDSPEREGCEGTMSGATSLSRKQEGEEAV